MFYKYSNKMTEVEEKHSNSHKEEKKEEEKMEEEKSEEQKEEEKEEAKEEEKEEEKEEVKDEEKEEEKREKEIPKELLNTKYGQYKLKHKNSEEIQNKNIPLLKDRIDQILFELKNYSLLVNKFDTYGNAIPLGAFCFAISFILYGFYEAKANEKDDFIFYILLLFGGLGQIISGILEYIKGRTFPANLYLLYGIYFSCEFYFKFYDRKYNVNNDNNNKDNNSSNENDTSSENTEIIIQKLKGEMIYFYYGSWAVLSFPIFIGSLQSNLFFLLQTLISFVFFVIRCIGEKKNNKTLNETVSGILELITGFISLYICINQIINGAFKFRIIPSVPLSQENDIDIDIKREKKE